MISDRINDKGLSVRKRAIAVLAKICAHSSSPHLMPFLTPICASLVTRVNDDEESVRELVVKTLKGTQIFSKTLLNLFRIMVF